MEAVLVLAGGAVDAAPTGGMVLPGDPAPGLDTGTAVTPGAPALPLLGAGPGGFVSTASWSSPSTTALDWTMMVVDPVRLAQPDADLLRHAPIFSTLWFWVLAGILRAKTLGKSVLIKKRTFDQIRGALLIKFGI